MRPRRLIRAALSSAAAARLGQLERLVVGQPLRRITFTSTVVTRGRDRSAPARPCRAAQRVAGRVPHQLHLLLAVQRLRGHVGAERGA
jgi:hypothetical protein